MAKILVSLVSDQVIPNIRFIKEFKSVIDSFIFITTKEMEEKGKISFHQDAMNISLKKSKIIIVDKFSFSEIEDTLLEHDFNEQDEYLVNITGGTKPMSIVAMSFFSSYKNSKIYYVPIGEGVYRQVFPRLVIPEKQFEKKLTLKEYFIASNLKLLAQESKTTRNTSYAQSLLNKFIQTIGNIEDIDIINRAHDMDNPEDRTYYSGGWFEELIFDKIKKKFELDKNQIAYNVELKNQKSENEYDAVFVHEESIYIVECKAYYGKTNLRKKVEKDLYKLGALDDNFGLKVTAIYITTADLKGNSINEYRSLMNRANSLRVKLFQLDDLINDKFLNKI